jgi:hypothetical protein
MATHVALGLILTTLIVLALLAWASVHYVTDVLSGHDDGGEAAQAN